MSRPDTRLGRLLRFLSRISIRLLAFNVLVVFLPALGILSLETYEEQLLVRQEQSMVQQGRILAAALGGRGALGDAEARRILINMEQRFDARLRVVDRDYNLLADSSLLGPPTAPRGEPAQQREAEGRESRLYRLGSFLYRALERLLPPEAPLQESEYYDVTAATYNGEEIQAALAGRYGSALRRSQATRSLLLYSAIPIRDGGEVVGVALVSKSTFRILRDLYELRLGTFRVVLASVAAAIVLTLLMSTTIARPLTRLRQEARDLLDRRGRLRGRFRGSDRLDEIGDLSRALAELTRRLEGHIRFIESFASDVSHEFKNPLAAIRNATELLAEVDDPGERQRFLAMAQGDIARLEHLLSGVREITHIDAQLDEEPVEPVPLAPLLGGLVERYEMQPGAACAYVLDHRDGELVVEADPARLGQVFENLLDNATSFSPAGGEVRIELENGGRHARVRIRDQGPGIPEEHLGRIFSRFFSYRPDRGDGHTGLGLAIVKAIVEGYGGAVAVRNGEAGGAVFEVELPLAG